RGGNDDKTNTEGEAESSAHVGYPTLGTALAGGRLLVNHLIPPAAGAPWGEVGPFVGFRRPAVHATEPRPGAHPERCPRWGERVRLVYLRPCSVGPGGPAMNIHIRWLIAIAVGLVVGRGMAADRPNVVVILADDIGYGDLSCYGATKVRTPNLDALAAQGRRFTDAHCAAAVCTPTRYALLTGQSAWRHPPARTILSGVAPLAIPLDRLTVPKLFRQAGYATAAVGKWHLGLGEKA